MMNSYINPPVILWADDDLDDIAILRNVLLEIDSTHEIKEVDNGRKVLDYLQQVKQKNDFPCLIVLDMNMPVLSGRETLVLLKNNEEFKEIPVVVFTTSNSSLDRIFCKRFNVEMITKPLTYNSFKDTIEKLVSFCNTPQTSRPFA